MASIQAGTRKTKQQHTRVTMTTCITSLPFSFQIYDYTFGCGDRCTLIPNFSAKKMQAGTKALLFATISSQHRGILVDWIVEVVEHFGLCDSILDSTICLLDCTLSTRKIDKRYFQLYAISCFFVVTRHIVPPARWTEETLLPSSEECAQITDNTYTALQIEGCCHEILDALDSRKDLVLFIPSSFKSLQNMLSELGADTLVRNLSMVRMCGMWSFITL